MLTTVFKCLKPTIRSQTPLIRCVFSETKSQNDWKDRNSAVEKDFFNKEDGFSYKILFSSTKYLCFRKGDAKIAR